MDTPQINTSVYERIISYLDEHEVAYQAMQHAPTATSQEAAEIRNTPIETGAKALVLKLYGGEYAGFVLVVFPAHRKFDSKKLKNVAGAKKSRFASKEELMELTSLVPGSVPPFGHPILPLPLFVDPLLVDRNETISFNAGMLTRSIVMPSADYRRIVNANFFALSRD